MKKALLSVLMLFGMVLGIHAQVPQTLNDGYKLVWHDEFDTPGRPNPANWTYEHGFVRNHEWQWYQSENATVTEDGVLLITARQEDRPCPWYREGSKDWKHNRKRIECTSASVITRGLHEFLYGRFVIRARIPASRGSWPAIWMLGSKAKYGWPSCGEVDIMEYYPKRGVPSILANACWGNDKGGSVWDESVKPFTHFTDKDPLWATQFHIWRMDWDEDYIRIYLDDELLNEKYRIYPNKFATFL
jgi:beta-glucanase (GH16 family)